MYNTKNNLFLFSERLQSIRKSHSEKQNDLAKALGMARSSISMYENGIAIPDIDTLIKIASHYRVSADYLLGLDDTTTHDIECIREEIGLSEEAIDTLRYHRHNKDYFEKDFVGLNHLIIKNDNHRLLRAIGLYTSTFDLSEEDIDNEAIYDWYNWNNTINVCPTVVNPEYDNEIHIDEISQSDVLYYKVIKALENTLSDISRDKSNKEEMIKKVIELYQKRFDEYGSSTEAKFLFSCIKNTFSFPIDNYDNLTKSEKHKYTLYYDPLDISKNEVRQEVAEIQQEYREYLDRENLMDAKESAIDFVIYKTDDK